MRKRHQGRTAARGSTLAILVGLALPAAAVAQEGIFENREMGNGTRRPDRTYEESRTISGDEGLQETLSFRLSR